MSAGITAIALATPIIASNVVFSMRRASRGIESFDENPIYALANMDIAAGQVLKCSRAVKSIAIATEGLEAAANLNVSGADMIRNMNNATKLKIASKKVVIVIARLLCNLLSLSANSLI